MIDADKGMFVLRLWYARRDKNKRDRFWPADALFLRQYEYARGPIAALTGRMRVTRSGELREFWKRSERHVQHHSTYRHCESVVRRRLQRMGGRGIRLERDAPTPGDVITYFAGAEDSYVKIGTTRNWPRRLQVFRTVMPGIRLIGWVSGNREREFHRRLHDYRRDGEWFMLHACPLWRATLAAL